MTRIDPPRNCPACPRLVSFREDWRRREPEWHNAPVPALGALDAPVLIVGLAPGLRGANRTGRPFTGDGAGNVLYPALIRAGFAVGAYGARPDDGLRLTGCRITNAVRCVPPENKPVGAEIAACNGFLAREVAAMPDLRIVLALGSVAHGAVLSAVGLRKASAKFAHGALHPLPENRLLANSYHCSRYNMSTRRLTVEMVDAVLADVAARL